MRLLAALVLVATAACATVPQGDRAPLVEAAAQVREGRGEARTQALAAWNAFLDGDVEEASSLAERALLARPSEPWALFLRAELARRALDPDAEMDAWLQLVERAPAHPLALVASGRILAFPGRSPTLDERLAPRLEAALADERLRGEARARTRGALRVLRGTAGADAAAEQVAESGLLTAGTVVGPFSDWHALEAGGTFAPEERRPVPGHFRGAGGAELPLRPFSFPTGALHLRGEEPDGDVYYVLAVADVPAGGRYTARLVTAASTSAAVFVDGTRVVERYAFGKPQPSQVAQAVELQAGSHLVAVRLVRGRGFGEAWVSLAPADGSAAAVRFRAAVPGDRPGVPPTLVADEGLRLVRDGASLAAGLAREGGVAGVYAAVIDTARKDPQGARALLGRALGHAPGAPPLLALRAELLEEDRTLPDPIAQARAAVDWEAVLAGDPGHGKALLAGAALLAAAGRHDEALEKLDAARAAAPGSSAPALAKMRVAAARGFDAEALALARSLTEGPDACSAWATIHDLARRIDAVATVDQAAAALAACPEGRSRIAALHAARGDLDQALALARRALADDPQDTGAAHRVAEVLVARGERREAVQLLEQHEALWPRNAWLPRRRAELLDALGDRAGARAARERSVVLQGGDVGLRRMLAVEAGRDLLDDVARDGLAVIRAYDESPRHYDSPAVLLLDFAAVEVYPDGSHVERVHTVTRILDKRGVDDHGEAHLPPGAEVIHLRTIKPDGRILVPETIEGKDSVSMPGLEVGDTVEIEYVVATSARRPALPGWSAAPFFFRSAGVPMVESVYVVRAAAEAGLELDVHNGMEGARIEEHDGWRTLTLRRTDVPALVPEPVAPQRREYLPWAQVGAGADETRLFPYFADGLVGTTDPTLEVAQWARETAAGVRGGNEQVVRALYDRAMREIEGSERAFGGTASQVLARQRGNRMLLLKAALDELGIWNRFAVIRPFEADPAPYRFPEAERWSSVALVVRPAPHADWIWLDPAMRWAPFGMLSPSVEGATAWVLPVPGETTAIRTTAPRSHDQRGRQVELRLALDEAGTLRGEGVERYVGYEAASVRAALEGMDESRRWQVIESSLARSFPGLTLESMELESDEQGVQVRYGLRVPGAARDLGDGRQVLQLAAFQSHLGRRFLARGSRQTPLLLATEDRGSITMQLQLPPGVKVERGADAAREHGPFGDYKRDVAVNDASVGIRESLHLVRQRIPPERYADFARWVAAVDRAQSVELVLTR